MPDNKEHHEDNKLALCQRLKSNIYKKAKGKNTSKRKFQIVLLEFS